MWLCKFRKELDAIRPLVIVSDIIHIHMHMYVLSNNCILASTRCDYVNSEKELDAIRLLLIASDITNVHISMVMKIH